MAGVDLSALGHLGLKKDWRNDATIAAKEHEPTVGHRKQSPIEACPGQKIGGTQISVETEGHNHHHIAWVSSKSVGLRSYPSEKHPANVMIQLNPSTHADLQNVHQALRQPPKSSTNCLKFHTPKSSSQQGIICMLLKHPTSSDPTHPSIDESLFEKWNPSHQHS